MNVAECECLRLFVKRIDLLSELDAGLSSIPVKTKQKKSCTKGSFMKYITSRSDMQHTVLYSVLQISDGWICGS